jgi:glucosamine-6-phosphate deaminase
LKIRIFEDKLALAEEAARQAISVLRVAQKKGGTTRILVATGASQIEFLEALTRSREVDWANVEMFHLDEYVGIGPEHPASFRKYLLDRVIRKTGIGNYHLLDGETDPRAACEDVGRRLVSAPVDLAFAGIGENCHLAFNDPPADFRTDAPYLLVQLDEACRRQQVGEGWFNDLSEVPERAISISIRQLLKSRVIICVVPEARKAEAVKRCVEGPINPLAPASILRTHPNVTLYLDRDSAALLQERSEQAVAEVR